MATGGLLHHQLHPHQYRPQESRSLQYQKFALDRLALSPHRRLARIPCNHKCLTRCLNHQGQSIFISPAQSEAQVVCSDTEAIEWVNNSAHDPMVEMDPITVLRHVLAERQASLMRAKEEKGSMVMASALPPPSFLGIRRPSDSGIGIAMAVIVLAVTAVIYFFRSRKNKDKKTMLMSLNGSSSLEPIRKLVKDVIKAPDSVLTQMAIGAASLGQAKGHNASTSPAFGKEGQNEESEHNAFTNSHCPSTIGNHPPFKVETVGLDVTEGPWFSQQAPAMTAKIEQHECEAVHVQSQGLEFANVTKAGPLVEQCVGGVALSEVQVKPPRVGGAFYGEVVSANLATKHLVEPKVDGFECEFGPPLVDGEFHGEVVCANLATKHQVESKVASSECDSLESERLLVNGELHGEFRSPNLATEQLVERMVEHFASKPRELEPPLVVDGEFYGEVNLATDQLVHESKVDRCESESSKGDNIIQPDKSRIVEKPIQILKQDKLKRMDIDGRLEDMLVMEKNASPSNAVVWDAMNNGLDLETDVGNGMIWTDIHENQGFSNVDRPHTQDQVLAVETAQVTYNLEDMHLTEGKSLFQGVDVTVPSQQDLFERVDESMESVIKDPNVLTSLSSQQVRPTEEEEEGFIGEALEQGSVCDVEEKQLLDGTRSGDQIHREGSAAEGDCVGYGAVENPAEDARREQIKALEAAVPALAIGAGTVGTLFGVAGGLQIVGFAALVSFISREFLWAQSRESLLQELSDITDRQKLLDFLKRRNVIRHE